MELTVALLLAISGVGCLLIAGVAVVVLLISTRSQRTHRDARAATAWQALLAASHARPEAHLCHVEQVYQRARRGSKAIIVWAATGQRQDAWFSEFAPPAGSTLLVSGSTGYGPHNDNPNVLYVGGGGVLACAPPGAQAAWRRAQEIGAQPDR